MAPRRGGGGGGYGGGGGSGGIGDTPWGDRFPLYGQSFRDPYEIAITVFDGISIFGIVAIIIWAMSSKLARRQQGSKLFRWFTFWLSALAIFVFFGIRFAVDILYGVEAVVQQIFFLIVAILYESEDLALISLLVVLYLLLPYCSDHFGRLRDQPRIWKGLRAAHALVIFILIALWLPAMALHIKYQVDAVIGDPFDFYQHEWTEVVRPFAKLDTALVIIYFFAVLEIVGWSVLGLVDVMKRQEKKQLQLMFVSLIAGPLLLRSTYLMGITIHNELREHVGKRQLSLATAIIYAITSLPIYAGIVAIARLIASANHPHPQPDQMNPSYNPNSWGMNGNQQPVPDPKNQMAVHETAPPVYQQYGGYPTPPPQQQQHGGYYAPTQQNQGGMPYPPQQQNHMQYQQPQPYPNQPQYQQAPYQNSLGHQQFQQQPYQSPSSPPPQQTRAVSQGGNAAPSEVNGSNVSELSSPTTTIPHAR